MADITKCTNEDCGLKHECYRFTATANEYSQSYFLPDALPSPVDGKCEYQIVNRHQVGINN